MTKNELNEIIRSKAREHGFETSEERGFHGFSDIRSEEPSTLKQQRTPTGGRGFWSRP